jgi:hypothetical protein
VNQAEGPSPIVLLATRLRHVDKKPFMAIMGLEDQFWSFDAFQDGEFLEAANDLPQHATGEAFCFACNHAWAAVAHTGTTELACPECARMTGRWKFGFYPSPGQSVMTCPCSNQLYYLTPEGHMCANCGIYQSY